MEKSASRSSFIYNPIAPAAGRRIGSDSELDNLGQIETKSLSLCVGLSDGI